VEPIVEMVLLFGIGEYKSGRDKLNQLIDTSKKWFFIRWIIKI